MPGVLQLEAMAQVSGILMILRAGFERKGALFLSADKVKFRRPVTPGDQLRITARITKTRAGKLAVAEAECSVDGQVASSAELMFTILEADAEPVS